MFKSFTVYYFIDKPLLQILYYYKVIFLKMLVYTSASIYIFQDYNSNIQYYSTSFSLVVFFLYYFNGDDARQCFERFFGKSGLGLRNSLRLLTLDADAKIMAFSRPLQGANEDRS